MHSATCQPIVYIGFSAVIGSWNTIEIRSPRTWRQSAPCPSLDRTVPSSLIEPETRAALGSRPSTERASMVLPEPDSPTMPSVSPGSMARLMPRTASTVPFSVGIEIVSPSISSSGPGREGGAAAIAAPPPCSIFAMVIYFRHGYLFWLWSFDVQGVVVDGVHCLAVDVTANPLGHEVVPLGVEDRGIWRLLGHDLIVELLVGCLAGSAGQRYRLVKGRDE